MRRVLALLVATLGLPAAAAAQELDTYVVNVVELTPTLFRLQFRTVTDQPEQCPLIVQDLYLSVERFDEEGFVEDGLLDLTTAVPPDAECVDIVGPWSGALELYVGGGFPQLYEGRYEVVIDDSFEGELWVEFGYAEFTGDEYMVFD